MKLTTKIFLILTFSFCLLFANTIINDFTAESDGDNVLLTWISSDETSVKHYELLRGSQHDNLTYFATIPAKGNNSTYTFVDQSAYKTTGSFYAYGLVVVEQNGSKSAPTHTRIDHNVSSVKRTWGSIKALFR